MRLLVCGGRGYANREFLYKFLDAVALVFGPSVLINGWAKGADMYAYKWASSREVPIVIYLPEWEIYGKSAGPIRNEQMLKEGKPDLVVCFPGGKGTAHMKRIAEEAGVQVIEAMED